jgi:hypothetical protein
MPPFLQLHALAATRGDGLRPELRMLFERLSEEPQAASNVAAALNLYLREVIDLSSCTPPMRSPFGVLLQYHR